MALAHEQQAAAPHAERSDLSADELKRLGENGEAFRNPDGSYSFPIQDVEALKNAIRAVGRSGADHDAVRRFIMRRAHELGADDLIPDTWNKDGSLKTENSRPRKPRHRAVPLLPEVRHFTATGLEVRAEAGGRELDSVTEDADTIVVTGAPIVYNQPYTVVDMLGEFTETMAPGVASRALAAGADVRLLINHEGLPLARTTAGTLVLRDGPDALRFEARLDARQSIARDLAIAVQRGDVSQMSCGFVVARDQWNDGMTERRVEEFSELLDISAVTYPASPTTSIEVMQRTLAQMPVESRARLRQMYVQLRAGKTLSASNQQHIVNAAKALHAVLAAAGFDPADLLDDDAEPVTPDPAADLAAETATSDDDAPGTVAEDDSGDAQPMPIPDGAAQHDPGEPVRLGDQPPNLSAPPGLDPMRAVPAAGESDGEPSTLDDGTAASGFSGPPGSPGWDDGTGTRSAPIGRLVWRDGRMFAEMPVIVTWSPNVTVRANSAISTSTVSYPNVSAGPSADARSSEPSSPSEPGEQPGSAARAVSRRASFLRLRAEAERRKRNRV